MAVRLMSRTPLLVGWADEFLSCWSFVFTIWVFSVSHARLFDKDADANYHTDPNTCGTHFDG